MSCRRLPFISKFFSQETTRIFDNARTAEVFSFIWRKQFRWVYNMIWARPRCKTSFRGCDLIFIYFSLTLLRYNVLISAYIWTMIYPDISTSTSTGDIMGGCETSVSVIGSFAPMERVVLSANGNLQRIMRYCFDVLSKFKSHCLKNT